MPQGPNAPYTLLDENQIVQRVFEESEDRLRVDAAVSVVLGTVECVINASSGDNIAIADKTGTNFLVVNPDGSINISGTVSATNPSVSTTGTAIPASATMIGGSDGTNLRAIRVSATGVVTVDGSGFTQPVSGTVTANAGSGTFAISAASLPLPSGAATSANQATEIASLASIDSKLTSPITVTGPLTDTQLRATPVPVSGSLGRTWTLSSGTDSIASVQSGTWNINNISGTISLPTGAATSANQATEIASLASIDSKLTSPLTVQATNLDIRDLVFATDKVDVSGSSVSVSNFPATQPISGTIAVSNFPVDADAYAQASTTSGQLGNLNQAAVTAAAPVYVDGNTNPLSLTTAGSLRTSVTATVLPPGAATSANQTSGNSTLALIFANQTNSTQKTQVVDGSGTVQGPFQTISGTNYAPVVLDASATPGVAVVSRSIQIAGSDGTNAQTISVDTTGKLNLNNISGTISLPTGAATSALQTTGNTSLSSIDSKLGTLGQKTMAGSAPVVIASDQSAIPISGTVTATNSANGNTGSAVPVQATQVGGSDGTNLRALKVSSTGVLSVDGSATTQPISGTVTANIGTTGGLALDTSVNGILVSQGSTTSGEKGPLIQGAVTTAVPSYADGNTNPLSLTTAGSLRVAVTTSVLPTGASTSVGQASGNASLATILSNQTNGTQVTNITGTVPLPTGAATAANQSTEISSLSSIVTNTNNLSLTQGSTTPGQLGNLGLSAVYSTLPGYSDGTSEPLTLDLSGQLRTTTVGNISSGSLDGGAPVKVGAVFNTVPPTFTNGQRGDLQINSSGSLLVSVSNFPPALKSAAPVALPI